MSAPPAAQPAIPMVDVARLFSMIEERASEAVMDVLRSGRYIFGPDVAGFEREMAAYLGTAQAVGVGSGTDALYLALKALGVGPGDEVITTPHTFVATAEAAACLGAVPKFVDIEEDNFGVDPALIPPAVTDRTKAVIAVHLYGHPADVKGCLKVCRERGLSLIEDCAQSLGAEVGGSKAGTFGDASTFSFFPTKNLGGAGDGGMVCTDDTAVADRVRMLRVHGSQRRYCHEAVGLNSRLDTVQAAFLRVKLEVLDEWNDQRASVAAYYDANLKGVTTPTVREGYTHSWHQYTIRSANRDELRERLDEAGIASIVYYPVPLHLQPCFAGLGYRRGDMPVTEKAIDEILSLPIFPGMTEGEMERVCETVAHAA